MKNIYYRFKSVSVEQFATLDDKWSTEEKNDFETKLSFRYLKDNRILVSRSEVTVYQDNNMKMKSVFDCFFDIKEECIEDIKKDGSIVFPRDFLIQLASLNYGTLRGVIIEKIKGIGLSPVILPPLIVGDVIEGDLSFECEKE